MIVTQLEMDTTNNCSGLTESLGLQPGGDDMFVGRLRGFPVGLKVIGSGGSELLLFQVRHLCSSEAKEVSRIQYPDEVAQLVAEKQVEIEFENKVAWVTFVDAGERLDDDSVGRLIESVLNSFVEAGVSGNSEVCHYCQRNKVASLTCHEGKVSQICPTCLSERLDAPANRTAEATEGAVPVFVLAPLAGLAGAVGWAACWIGYELLFELLHTNVIIVPHLLEAVLLVCVAGATGGPVGFVIKRIRRRGQHLSIGFAVLATLGAVVTGEVMFISWLIYREYKVFSPRVAWEILPQLEMQMGGFHLGMKVVAALVAVVLAAEMAKPKKPRLNL